MAAAPVGVISPHLDDAVLSCGQVIRAHPGSVVLTVFAGRPEGDPLAPWDGFHFQPGDAPMPARWEEDRRACRDLGATPVHLDHLDTQYGSPAPADDVVAEGLRTEIARAGLTTWLVPLGIRHPDHIQTHRAAAQLFARLPGIRWVVYEELPYRIDWPADTAAALAGARGRLRLSALSHPGDPDLEAKERSIRHYDSQLGPGRLGEGSVRSSLTAETYWLVD